MENGKNKVETAIERNKLEKYGLTKKSLYSGLSIISCIILIVALSLAQAEFNPEKIKTISFWIGVIVLSAICIFGLITGQQVGDDMSRNNPKGAFRTVLTTFRNAFKSVENIKMFAYFEDWIEVYRNRKVRNKIKSTLSDAGIYQEEVLDLDLSELDNLKTPWKKVWDEEGTKITYFKSCTEEQINTIRECLKGNIKVSRLPKSFFVNALNKSEKDIWESAAHADAKKNAWLSSTYMFRILSLVAMNVIWAGLDSSANQSTADLIISLASRVFCLIVSVVWGIYIGFELVKMDITYIEFKAEVLNQYREECENKTYVPISLEEKAKKEFEEYEAKKPKVEVVDKVAEDYIKYESNIMLLGENENG